VTTTTLSKAGERQSGPTLDLHGETTSPLLLARSVWRSRELLVLLARKEFHVRYRRASFGTLWAVALPLLQSAVMAIVFSHVVRFSVPHYPIFILSGMLAWTYFSAVFATGGTGIVDNADISSRVYFPRALLPLVSVGTNLYGLVITLVILVALCPLFGVSIGLRFLFMVPAIALLVAFTASLSLVTAALHVYFRDVRYIVTASLLLLLYVSPVIYPPGLAPHVLRGLLDVNPLTGILALFHDSTIGTVGGDLGTGVVVSVGWTVGLFGIATWLYSRFDRVFADLL
jgi:lipopolysaccharide transport system permease protein